MIVGHWGLGLGWTTAGLLGAAVAPTDPAVMFSVLGDARGGGRTGTILEGESGANDPVGIALMIGMIEFATHADAQLLDRRPRIPRRDVHRARRRRRGRPADGPGAPPRDAPELRPLHPAGAGRGGNRLRRRVGRTRLRIPRRVRCGPPRRESARPFRTEIGVFEEALSSLAEIVVFGVLGLTIDVLLARRGRLGGRAPARRGRRARRATARSLFPCSPRPGSPPASARSSPGAD